MSLPYMEVIIKVLATSAPHEVKISQSPIILGDQGKYILFWSLLSLLGFSLINTLMTDLQLCAYMVISEGRRETTG